MDGSCRALGFGETGTKLEGVLSFALDELYFRIGRCSINKICPLNSFIHFRLESSVSIYVQFLLQ